MFMDTNMYVLNGRARNKKNAYERKTIDFETDKQQEAIRITEYAINSRHIIAYITNINAHIISHHLSDILYASWEITVDASSLLNH